MGADGLVLSAEGGVDAAYMADFSRSSSNSVILLRSAFTSCRYRSSAQALKRLGVREDKVPGLGRFQHQELLRFVGSREQDDEYGGVSGETDVGEDVQQGG